MNIETNEEILNLKSKVNLYCSICDKCCEYRGDIKITPINVLEISKFLKIVKCACLEQCLRKVRISLLLSIKPPKELRKALV